MIPAHPKITRFGQVRELCAEGTIEITEKVDGSQFGFGLNTHGELVMRSKGQAIFPPPLDHVGPVTGMFAAGVESILFRERQILESLKPGTYLYGEYLSTPKHNTLAYGRVPKGHVILFGGTWPEGGWMNREDLVSFGTLLDLEVVPQYWSGVATTPQALKTLCEGYLERESVLGKEKIEGVVVKNYSQMVHLNGVLSPATGKIVSADFKERHVAGWTKSNDKLADFLDHFNNDTARYTKTLHRLRDEGKLTGTVKDIGPLVVAVQNDLLEEESTAIKEFLYAHFVGKIKRGSTQALAAWYKERLEAELVCDYCNGSDLDSTGHTCSDCPVCVDEKELVLNG